MSHAVKVIELDRFFSPCIRYISKSSVVGNATHVVRLYSL